MGWCSRAFFTTPSELRETETRRNQPKTRENTGNTKQTRTRCNEPQANAKGDSAKRAQTGQQANADAERATGNTADPARTTHDTRRNHTQPPDPARPPRPLSRTRGQQDKREMCRASTQLIRVSFYHALDLRSCGPHWTCSAGTQLCRSVWLLAHLGQHWT